jgi:hypothetical protein
MITASSKQNSVSRALCVQKRPPSLTGQSSALDHVFGHRRLRDLKAELKQFTGSTGTLPLSATSSANSCESQPDVMARRKPRRVLDLDPSFRGPGAIRRGDPFRHDALKPDLAHGAEQRPSVCADVLDAATRGAKKCTSATIAEGDMRLVFVYEGSEFAHSHFLVCP